MQQTVEQVAVDEALFKVVIQGSGESVVLIHGAVLADEFAAMAAEPDLRDYQLIRYHRRGYGGSAGAPGRASVEQDAADCSAMLAALGVERAHVAGRSYGGAVAVQLAVDAPNLVHSLALLEPALLAVPSAAQFAGGGCQPWLSDLPSGRGRRRPGGVPASSPPSGGHCWKGISMNGARVVPNAGGERRSEDHGARGVLPAPGRRSF